MEGIKRDYYWDVLKGLGIIAVVLGHSGFWQYILILNMYHMALFFFVGGCLYNDKYTSNPTTYIMKKFKDLWLPLIKYTVIFIALHNLFIKLNIYSTIAGQTMIYPKEEYSLITMVDWIVRAIFTGAHNEEIIGATWFVFPMLIAMIGYCFVRNIVYRILTDKRWREIVIYIICWVLSIIGMMMAMKQLKFTWRLDIALLCMVIIGSGYLFFNYGNRDKINGIVAIVGIIILFYFNKKGLNISFAGGTIGEPVQLILVTCAGIYVNLYIAKIIVRLRKEKSTIIALLGRNSFHIMALHFLGMKVINIIDIIVNKKEIYMLAMFPYSNAQWWVLNMLGGLFIPIILIYSLKYLGRYFRKYEFIYSDIS